MASPHGSEHQEPRSSAARAVAGPTPGGLPGTAVGVHADSAAEPSLLVLVAPGGRELVQDAVRAGRTLSGQ